MTNKRCIKCESTKDKSDFDHGGIYGNYCDHCWRNNDNNELFRYEWTLDTELFYLRYPTPRPESVSIPGSDKGKKDLVKDIKKRIGERLEEREAGKSRLEKDTSSDAYKDAVADIKQLKAQQAQVLQLEKKYNN